MLPALKPAAALLVVNMCDSKSLETVKVGLETLFAAKVGCIVVATHSEQVVDYEMTFADVEVAVKAAVDGDNSVEVVFVDFLVSSGRWRQDAMNVASALRGRIAVPTVL